MRKRTLAAAAIGTCAVALWTGVAARADDAPKDGRPPAKPVAKLEDPFLSGLVGSWEVSMEGFGSTGTGVSRARRVCGDTTLLQETRMTVGGRPFFAVTTMRVDETGKGVRIVRFDMTSGADAVSYGGPLSADRVEASSDAGMTWTLSKKDGAYVAVVARGGMALFTSTYVKASKDVEIETPSAPTEGFLPAVVGTWKATGEWTAAPQTLHVTGTSTLRWALGGSMMLHEYERRSEKGPAHAFGAYRWSAPGTLRAWWFDTDHLDPMPAEGPLTDTAWHGKGTFPDGDRTAIGLEWTRKGDGHEMRYEMSGKPAGFETYVKAK